MSERTKRRARAFASTCNSSAANTWWGVDHQCVSSCPTYLYFPTNNCTSGFWCNDDPRYNSINDNDDEEYFNTTTATWYTKEYRRYSKMCHLCDYRCVQCTGPLNVHCTECANFYYRWRDINGAVQTVCDEECPPGQYIYLDSGVQY